ncbi:hypothetical protein SCUCBS95973_002235 [Sporothrix curviconia]|uniref:Uncharacterized protein n=1 Tax=Sporothrix curviconia TaxID=1260050 RepID=A0ABP0B5A3_9PEZI
MASSCPGTPRLDGEAAVKPPTDSTSVATALLSFADAPKPNITSADLAPTRRPHPRPWCRVAVPGAGSKIGLRTVWKRIGGVPRSKEDARYVKGFIELLSDGQGPRKTRRTERHVSAWGDAHWADLSLSLAESVEGDLARAREAVANVTVDALGPEQSTPEQQLSHIPRKRNGRRQPLAVSQPTPPTPSAPISSPVRIVAVVEETADLTEETAEHITKRAKRRMSRRISMMPRLDGGSLLSPAKKAAQPHVFSSPIKRKVAEAPSEPATPATPATPAAPVPTIAPIAFEPTFSSPIKTLSPVSKSPLSAKIASPQPARLVAMSPAVVFDRPVAEIEIEPPHEARRRESLYNTRRRETLFAAVERKPLEPASSVRSNRRHSFVPQQTPLVFESTTKKETSSRRHTFQPGALGIFLEYASHPFVFDRTLPDLSGIPCINVSESDDTTSVVELSGLDESTVHDTPLPTQDATVVVDVRTNLDIFGSGPPVQTHHSPSSDRHVSFDLKVQADKPTELLSPARAEEQTAREQKTVAEASEDATKPNNHPLDVLSEEDTMEVSNDSTPRSLSPELEMDTDMDTSAENSREVTDDMRIVSSRPTSELDESLLLPLPETTETEGETEMETTATGDNYGWQSPTSAELGHLTNALDTPQQTAEPAEVAPSPLACAVQIDIDADFLLDDNDDADDSDIAEDAEAIEEAADVEEIEDVQDMEDVMDAGDVFREAALNSEDIEDSPSPAPSVEEEEEEDEEEDSPEYTVTQPFNMFNGAEEDATTTMTMDLDTLAEDQLSSHSDSETEMLRKFVTRVKADKTAKAAAAAEEASARSLAKLQRKRRSGSTGSTASSSGSPMTKKEGAGVLASPFNLEPRVPFGKKDHNMSPSPKRKRRAVTVLDSSDENRTGNLLSKPLFDDNSPPRPKRRRRKMEADTGGIFNPEFVASGKKEDSAEATSEEAPGPRRSKRTRSQTPVKTAASATNSALSLIPVRLPGSLNLNGEDSYGLSASNLSLRRNDEKDLTATTRVNTRKNRGNADPPCVVVARQSHEALRALREQKSVFDSPLVPQKTSGKKDKDKTDGDDDSHKKVRRGKKASNKPAKSVRWAEVLARFQTADGEAAVAVAADKAAASSNPESVEAANDGEPVIRSALSGSSRVSAKVVEQQSPVDVVAAMAAVAEPEVVVAIAAPPTPSTSATSTTVSEPEKKSVPRRTTRVSRLQPPTPRKVIASAAAAKAAAAPAIAAAPASAPAEPAPMGLKASGAAPAKRMATRRAKIAGMGMAGNGTPAPKRRMARTT